MMMKKILWMLGVVGVLTFTTTAMAGTLVNYNFEDFPGGTRAANWSAQYSATVANQYVKGAVVHEPYPALYSQGVRSKDAVNQWTQIYQGFDTNVGDAMTMQGWYYPLSAATGVRAYIGTNTSTDRATTTWLYAPAGHTRTAWNQTTKFSWNAEATTTYLFMESRRLGAVDCLIYFDDFTWGHAYVPPAPDAVAGNGSADVNVDPGANLGDDWGDHQFAITIGGGGYTLGSDWIQSDGSVNNEAAWQTDAAWGTETIAGLTNGVEYTLKVVARSYGSATSTDLAYSGEATVTPMPEPGALALLGLGLPFVLKRRRRA